MRPAAAIESRLTIMPLSDSEPEPDLALLLPRDDFYGTSKPKESDAILVIEISDTSLAYDREIKLPMYAQAGTQEFWIVNLIESKVEVYRQPLSSGIYSSRSDFSRGDALSPLAFADAIFLVDEMLG